MKIAIVENPRPLSIEHYNDVANAPLSASLNSGYALAVARACGWDTVYLDFSGSQADEVAISCLILAEQADIVLFHWVYAWGHEPVVVAVLDLLKRAETPLIGAFGLFPTLACRRLSGFAPQLDFILVGEFEQTLHDLLQQVRPGQVPGPCAGLYRAGQEMVRRAALADLSRLPVPDDMGANLAHGALNIAASRGCFGDCGFCFINVYYGCRKRRERSVESLAHELETRLARREVRQVYFVDPTFIGHSAEQKERIAAIGEVVQAHHVPFGFEARVDTITDDLVAPLVRNGASSIFLGIESGCEAALQRMNKRITPEQIAAAVACVRNHGLRLSAGFIMFEPDTTREELLRNYGFLDRLGLLSDHDQTINMLYHSQIVLFGSRGWSRFESAGRLVADPSRPFEASYRFKDAQVAKVCSAMRGLATAYFTGVDALHRQAGATAGERHDPGCPKGFTIDDDALNRLLKEGFLAFVKHAGRCTPGEFAVLERNFIRQVQDCLAG
ncbi:radical SAM protein [Geobacter sp. SVR]|uniref:B12-binding domain-containing radical SAM protein n=1 Tax=Geobacter sp. SVR TaxID=2495594 RepID=UPI00143EFA7A|nr:radical SAM protein [Geobacter sp. SVR]BCS55315.1 hypothetical protein GSVR_36230 [Geobacter sp. SVR]GCF87240.1 hypothetical protein GSbR_38400 [Geobacter sp. SVR]